MRHNRLKSEAEAQEKIRWWKEELLDEYDFKNPDLDLLFDVMEYQNSLKQQYLRELRNDEWSSQAMFKVQRE